MCRIDLMLINFIFNSKGQCHCRGKRALKPYAYQESADRLNGVKFLLWEAQHHRKGCGLRACG